MFETTDLNLASYLMVNGLKPEITKTGNRGTFKFPGTAKVIVEKYYDNNGSFMEFAQNQRTLKSRVKNI